MHWRRITIPLLLCLLCGPVWAQKRALVKARETLSLRAKPSVKSEKLETLLRYQPVEILKRQGTKWARVKTIHYDEKKSKTGWVLAAYLTRTGFVSTDHAKLNGRAGPGTGSGIAARPDRDRGLGWPRGGRRGHEPCCKR